MNIYNHFGAMVVHVCVCMCRVCVCVCVCVYVRMCVQAWY